MTTTIYPDKYLTLVGEDSKNLIIVVQIDGVPFYFSSGEIFTTLRYGDPGIHYGDADIVYGGLRSRTSDVKSLLNLDASMTIGQKIEPEQGRGAITLLSLSFTDKDGYMSQVISPGVIIDEILGNKFVKVWLGFQNSSFPEDYLVILRGYIAGVKYTASKVDLQIADPNVKRKTDICVVSKTSLSSDIDSSVVIIPVVGTDGFYDQIPRVPSPFTFAPADINTATDVITIPNHTLLTGDIVQFQSTITMPSPLTVWTPFYAIVLTPNTFKVASSLANANTNVPINLTTTGSGVLTLTIYDSAITTYIKIGDEFMEYRPGGLSPTSVTVLSRGSRPGFPATSHSLGDEVDNIVQIQDNVINISLKMALSGWNGPFISSVPALSIVDTTDPSVGLVADSILISGDSDLEYGLTPGDWVTISGSGAGNDGIYQITDIRGVLSTENNLLVVSGSLNVESPATGVTLAFRSQFDTYPIACGAKLAPFEVDVAGLITLKDQFLAQNEYRMRFLIFDPINLKNFTEMELFLPIGMYSLTRYGRLSGNLTKPPIADQKLIILSKDNIVNHPSTTVQRALNTRRYFSEIDYSFDLADDNSTYQSNLEFIDAMSLSKITISTPLPIQSKGLRTDLGAASLLIPRQALFLARRYNNVAYEITLQVNFETISQLEAGDVVDLRDNGDLKLVNFNNGTRNSGEALYEVIDRKLDLKTGMGTLTLLSTLGVQVNDRFATISPSSIVGTGSTTTKIIITDSFGQFFPNNESKKWIPTIGLTIFVHDTSYGTVSAEVTLTGIDPTNDHALLVSPALGFTPSAGMIVEIAKYPASDTSPSTQQLYKLLYAHIDPSVPVTGGSDNFHFTVSLPNATLFQLNLPVLVHNTSYSVLSPEALVTNIDTGTGIITVDTDLGFTPSAGQTVELIGFADGGGPYRIL